MPKTRFVKAGPEPDGGLPLTEIAASLLGGAVAAYPTETFYALGAAAFSKQGIERIYRLKERDRSKPLSVMASDLDMVREITRELPAPFTALAGEFWPGPLTLVLPAAAGLPEFLLGPGRTVAVRIPPLGWLRALVRELAEPLTATSANLAGRKELAEPAEVAALVGDKVEWLIDGGRTPGGLPSTIVDLSRGTPQILREGAISGIRIKAFLGF
jgi:L-threonylcarbamoyladenylate synthase